MLTNLNIPNFKTRVPFKKVANPTPTARPAKINGNSQPLKSILKNGDQVEILTSNESQPSPLWERFAATSKVKSQIRKFMRSKKYSKSKKYIATTNIEMNKANNQKRLPYSRKTIIKQPTSSVRFLIMSAKTIAAIIYKTAYRFLLIVYAA